ncbi:MAG: dienelactone hydrolase family protein, partial [Anaerolineae bacterium]|nr:dienelactone hydrolase family protein [Anaerolineae bacterium]
YGSVRDLATDEIASQVSVPLMGNFGEADGGIPPDVVQAAEQMLKQHGKTCDFYVFPDAPHAFFNDTRPHIYQEAASKAAWERTLGWFRQYLQ